MDPVTGVCNALASVNNVITAIINKANPAEVDALIAAHIRRVERLEAMLAFLANKLFHVPVPTPDAATSVKS